MVLSLSRLRIVQCSILYRDSQVGALKMSHSDPFHHSVQLADLTASRLIHEIVGPIGVISNGLELMEELGADAGDDAMTLVSSSAMNATNRLKFYRIAYGRSGVEITSIAELRAVAVAFMADQPRHDLSWPLPPALPSLSEGMGRVMLILIEIAKDCLPRGGLVRVSVDGGTATVIAQANSQGDVAQMPDALGLAVTGTASLESLTPQTVHGALAWSFIHAIGGQIALQANDGSVQLSVGLSID